MTWISRPIPSVRVDVHDLDGSGFEGAPGCLGPDPDGREILSSVEGREFRGGLVPHNDPNLDDAQLRAALNRARVR